MIYVAPPDFHLWSDMDIWRCPTGPKRAKPGQPSILCSGQPVAAYPGRVTGVILTGTVDDGVAGLAEIKRPGGVAIVDPSTLWSAIVALEEAAEVLEALPPHVSIDRQERARKKREQAVMLRAMLSEVQ